MKKISRISGCSGDLPEYFLQFCCVGGNAVCGQYGGWDRHGANHFDEEKNRRTGMDSKDGQKVSQKVVLQRNERPGKGVAFHSKRPRIYSL